MRPLPRCPALPALLALLVLNAGCGERVPPARYAVVQRELAWTARPERPDPPLSLTWDFSDGAADLAGFTSPGGSPPVLRDGALELAGLDRVALRTPKDAGLNPDLHHQLVFELHGEDVTHLRLRWRGTDEPFDEGRSTPGLPLELDRNGDGVFSLPISDLRGVRHARDASEGLVQLELAFEGGPGSRPLVRIQRLALVSGFDQPSPGPTRLERHGIARRGTALALPGMLSAELAPGPDDRLRLALAPAGASGPTRVVVQLAGVSQPLAELALAPDAGWRELSLSLAPAHGQPCQLQISAEGEDGLLLLGSPLRLAPSDRPRPPVVLYLEDTLRADRLSVYGHPFPTDPALRRLAAEGVVWERAYGASSWTRPSVASLLTSLDPLAHGVTTHLQRLAPAASTLAERLADAGWITVSLVTNYHGGAWAGLDQGFDVAAEPTAWGASRLKSTLTSALVAEPLERLLQEHRDEALFVHVHTLDPHEPYQPPGELLYSLARTSAARPPIPGGREREDESLSYDAEVLHNDARLGALLQALDATGRADDTLLLFLSDHGEAFGEHGAFRHRQSLFEEELAVPWVLRWPGRLPAGARLSSPVGLVDVAPTVLGLLELPAPAAWQGRDLSAVLRGEAPAPRDEPVLAHLTDEQGRQTLAVMGARYKLLAALPAQATPTALAAQAAQDAPPGQSAPASSQDGGALVARALYDLDQDPGEQTDLLGTPPGDAAAAALLAWAEARLAQGRRLALDTESAPMDEATRRWMVEMGYLGR
ncbi:MAG: hypothetical protein DRQ55_10910 [Planctomycetota bacterium]|nr:MAG: hypothetical protein DRQ55_10910 [Planctomycetota bacterium]